jgi:hypothetical protein
MEPASLWKCVDPVTASIIWVDDFPAFSTHRALRADHSDKVFFQARDIPMPAVVTRHNPLGLRAVTPLLLKKVRLGLRGACIAYDAVGTLGQTCLSNRNLIVGHVLCLIDMEKITAETTDTPRILNQVGNMESGPIVHPFVIEIVVCNGAGKTASRKVGALAEGKETLFREVLSMDMLERRVQDLKGRNNSGKKQTAGGDRGRRRCLSTFLVGRVSRLPKEKHVLKRLELLQGVI